ncbi:hypothetical protein [Xanthobacter agilis]|jgi:hypothetical protein|uniref:Uncharacterized protein n=1 Tax=Xanthobacter agilis TaxID=47492 RepID=A0ABU0LD52_XANAG|nr:hypothetical protein [Xanthobacter agilis]MDQ0505068.1 hypothetical protein [Xanthobacter agilis]
MLRPLLAVSALAASALAVLTLPAAAQQKMAWHLQQTEESAALVFGVPETDEVMLFFVCKPGADGVTAQSQIGSKGLEKDAVARLILSAGSVKKSLAGKAIANEESGAVDVEAPTTLADVKALTKGGSSLSIEVKGAKQKLSLSGVGEVFAKFEAACKPKS